MRVLVLSPIVPGLGGSGGQTREHHLLRRLVGLGHEVAVCCPVSRAQAPQLQGALDAGIRVAGAARPSGRVRETAAALAARPALVGPAAAWPLPAWQLEVLWRGMEDLVRGELARRPEVAVVVWDLAAAWRRHLPRDLPCVLSAHDASWAYLESRARAAAPARRSLLMAEAARARRFARRWTPGFERVVCVSAADAGRFARAAPTVASTVVDNGVDVRSLTPLPPASERAVLFAGTLDYPPNAEAARWFAAAVWPRVRERCRDARLIIAGRRPSRATLALAGGAGIEVLADVQDMAAVYARAQVATAPLLSGGGTRLKILEAAAYGRPVVATPTGAEGLELEPGRHLVVESGADGFAAALVELLEDPGRRESLATSARALVEARYDWDALGDRYAAALSAARD